MVKALKNIVEDLNNKFEGYLVAEERNGLLVLTLTTRKYLELYEMEEQLDGALEYVIEKYDLDFNVVNHGKRSVVYEIYEY